MSFVINSPKRLEPIAGSTDLLYPMPVSEDASSPQAEPASVHIDMPREFFIIPNQIMAKQIKPFKLPKQEPLIAQGDRDLARIQPLDRIGQGAFGVVMRAGMTLAAKGETVEVAVKVNRIATADRNENEWILQQQVKEACLLEQLRHADPEDKLPFARFIGASELDDGRLCIVQLLCDSDLCVALKNNLFKTAGSIKNVAHQLFHGLQFLHFNRIVHCDLKPENILMQQNASESALRIRISDFGAAKKEPYTPSYRGYYVTRWYRPPEMLLSMPVTCAVDWWSLGCTLYEVCTRTPLFPANSSEELWQMHQEFLGPYPKKFVKQVERMESMFSPEEEEKEEYYLLPEGQHITPFLDRGRDYERQRQSPMSWEDGSKEDVRIRKGLFQVIQDVLRWDPTDRKAPQRILSSPLFDPLDDENSVL